MDVVAVDEGAPRGFAQFPDAPGERQWQAALTACRPALATPLPPRGRPLRVAFVGQETYFRVCASGRADEVLEPSFVEFRDGADADELRSRLDLLSPHVVVVFRPEVVPPGTLGGVEAVTLGYLTEPVPRADGRAHPDLERRLHALARIDGAQFDRVLCFDPELSGVVDRVVPVWRSCPLPVDDAAFGWREWSGDPRALFVGRSTAHREEYLLPAKHELDLLHVDHGIFGDDLIRLLAERCEVGINLHNEDYPTFENRVALHLAAGNLVVSEPLSPTHGLEPGLDYLEVRDPDQLLSTLRRVRDRPAAYQATRVRGRQKAELFRASRVWSRLIHDLLLDVAAFGARDRNPDQP